MKALNYKIIIHIMDKENKIEYDTYETRVLPEPGDIIHAAYQGGFTGELEVVSTAILIETEGNKSSYEPKFEVNIYVSTKDYTIIKDNVSS